MSTDEVASEVELVTQTIDRNEIHSKESLLRPDSPQIRLRLYPEMRIVVGC